MLENPKNRVLRAREELKSSDYDIRRMTREYIRYLGICLLYTSPSPRDRTRSRMPSSA